MIHQYIQNTKEYYKITISDVFEIEREGEKKIFNPLGLKNKKLLFHGSRFSNFPGILTNGLRIAPPEAPCAGYNFGKGVYLADFAGKSTPYSCPHLSRGEFILIMCEAALGTPKEKLQPDHKSDLPAGYHSTHALGRQRPNPSGDIMFEKDIQVPLGKKE